MIILCSVIAVIAGMAFVVHARRPHADEVYTRCVSCGYDVSGRDGAVTCTECGADLTAPRATVVVERTRLDRHRLGLGLLLVIVGLAGFVLGAW